MRQTERQRQKCAKKILTRRAITISCDSDTGKAASGTHEPSKGLMKISA